MRQVEKTVRSGFVGGVAAKNNYGTNYARNDCMHVWLYIVDRSTFFHQKSDASAVGVCRSSTIRQTLR